MIVPVPLYVLNESQLSSQGILYQMNEWGNKTQRIEEEFENIRKAKQHANGVNNFFIFFRF